MGGNPFLHRKNLSMDAYTKIIGSGDLDRLGNRAHKASKRVELLILRLLAGQLTIYGQIEKPVLDLLTVITET